jgi:N-hydroxyarylamine O-acetyltransferase
VNAPTPTDALTAALSHPEAAAYLARVGIAAPEAPTLAALASLHRAHLMTVPFENLDISLGRPIRLDRESLLRKVVGVRRGGYCYELNGLFALLLRSLGYAVDLVSARVSLPGGGLTAEFDHMALVVTSPDLTEPVLADVGFGDAFIEPLPLRDGFSRDERGKGVGLTRRGDLWHYRERLDGGEWHDQYVFTTEPHPLADFEPRNKWQQTAPESHFTRQRVASRLTPNGRVTVSGQRLITTMHGRREEVMLDGEAAVDAALAEHLGLVVT